MGFVPDENQRRPQKQLGRRLEEVTKAVGGGYCRLQIPLRLALAVRETVAGQRLGALEGAGGPPRLELCGVLVTRASTRQHKKILISGTIGAFRSGRRVADMAVLSPGTVMKSSGQRPPTENTVSGDTVLFPLHRLHVEMHMACTADFNPVPVQRYYWTSPPLPTHPCPQVSMPALSFNGPGS